MPIIITPTGPVPIHIVTIPITRDRVARGRAGARQDTPVLPVARTDLGDGGFNAWQVEAPVAKVPPLRTEIVKWSDAMNGFVVLPRRWVA